MCIAAGVASSARQLDWALTQLDLHADLNASRTYLDRTYGEDGRIVGSRRVVEDAQFWMPSSETYRIVIGREEGPFDSNLAPDFLRYLLLPRTESPTARYVFCFGCERTRLGSRARILSQDGPILFAEVSE